MSQIKSKNTSPENVFHQLLVENKITDFYQDYPLPGRPDFVLPKIKLAIFIDGCFWHKCPKHFKKPKSNIAFWKKKIQDNIERDKLVNKKLRKLGWKVIRLWEHEL